MSKEVDQRVVEMRFDNRQFEQGVKTTLGSLDALKKGLDFNGAASGLENVTSSVRKMDFNPLVSGVEAVKSKFSALEVMAVTALANITNSAVNTGKQIYRSLTVEPIKQGFDEYELKMGSVQTIMASTGASLAEVNGYLAELNTYADKTIYSFSDMTSSIGKFTNAGVDLKSAVKAIQGISNEAAVSGANAQQASHAMYNFAQALSSGSVKLIDWKSIENANMATVEFKQKLIDTALALGTVVKEGDKYVSTTTDANGNVSDAFDAVSMFNDSLSSQWMTTDVLVKTLGEYADETSEIGKKAFAAAQDVKTFSQLMDTLKEAVGSGWSETWEIAFGDFNEAKKLWTELSDAIGGVIDKQSEARNSLLRGGLSSGWKQLMDAGISDSKLFENHITEVAKANGVAVDDILKKYGSFEDSLKEGWATPEILKKSLNNMLIEIHKMSQEQRGEAGYTVMQIRELEHLTSEVNRGAISMDEFYKKIKAPSGRENLIQSVKNAFEGLMSVLKPVKDALTEVFPPLTAEKLYKFTENLRDLTAKLKLGQMQSDNLKAAFKGLFSAVKIVIDAVKAVAGGIISLAKNFSAVVDALLEAAAAVGDWFTNLHKSTEETNIFAVTVEAIAGVLQKAIDKIKEFFEIAKQKFDSVGFTTFLGVLKAIFGFAVKAGKVILDVGKKIGSVLLSAFQSGGVTEVIEILNGGLIGVFLVNVNKLIKGVTGAFGGVTDILGKVTGILDGVKGCLEAWQQNLKAEVLKKIATSIAILAGSLWLIATIDGEKLGNALGGLSVLFMELALTLSRFSKMEMTLKGTGKLVTIMLGVSISVLILAAALKKLSSLSLENLAKGLIGIFALIEMMALVRKQLDTLKGKAAKGALNIVILASAIKILASVCTDLAKLSWEELAKGLIGVGVLLAEVDIFLNTAKFSGKAFATCLGMIELAAAIKILASAAGCFAKMKWSEIAKGLAAIGGLLTELGLFINLTGKAKHITSTGFALIEIAAAMKIFASAVLDFSQMSWSEIGQGLTAMGVALAEIVISLKLMPKNVFGIGAGLIVVGAALNIISAALCKMGGMSWGEIAKSLAAMGGSMLILALGLNGMKKAVKGAAALIIAANALALLVPEIKILGSMSIQQIGIALLALAGSFLVLGVAAKLLSPLAGTMVKVAGAIALFGLACGLAGAGILAVSIGLTALFASLVAVVSSLGEIISGVCYSIADSAKAIAEAFVGLVEAACIALKGTIPLVADTLVIVLAESLTSLKTYLPKIVDLVLDIVVQLMDKLSLRIPEVVKSAVKMIGRIMDALDEALGTKGLQNLIKSMKSVALVFVAFAATAKIISGLSLKSVIKGLPAFAVAIVGFIGILALLGGISKIPGIGDLLNNGATIFAAMGKAIGAFAGCLITGIIDNLPKDVGQTVAAMGSIVTIVLALVPVVDALSSIETNIKYVLKGMASIGLVLAGLTVVVAALGGLSKIPGFNEIIESGGQVLTTIGSILGTFVGTLVNSLSTSITANLEQVITSLASVGLVVGAVAVITKIVAALKINPVAVAEGFAGIAIAIGCISAILAALGGLAQIPGFDWIIGEGAVVLSQIGSAIGGFVGSIIGGIGNGITAALPAMGENLSAFMDSVQPFIEGAKGIDKSVVEGILALSGAILILTAAELLSGINQFLSFITGGASTESFCSDLIKMGEGVAGFSEATKNVDPVTVTAAANAVKSLAQAASDIPNEGGLAAWFAGENNVADFGISIAQFGLYLKMFSENVEGVNSQNVVAAANAASALTEMAKNVPNEGGFAAWFAGENNVADFGISIARFGLYLKMFSENVEGVNLQNVKGATEAGKALAEMADKVPNEGGVVGFFAGENSLAAFGNEIAKFGTGLAQFGLRTDGINPDKIRAAAEAGKALAEMADKVPNEGGVAGFFAGENSLAKFGDEIEKFGIGLAQFGLRTDGINPNKIRTAAEAGKALAEMADKVPNENGIKAWFVGNNSLAAFGNEIAKFGSGLAQFGLKTDGIKPDKIRAASEAGKALAEMASVVPDKDGIKAWFEGDNSLAAFGGELEGFGISMYEFYCQVNTIKPEIMTSAANAAKSLAEMAANMPSKEQADDFSSTADTLGNSLIGFQNALSGLSLDNPISEIGKLIELSKTINRSDLSGLDKLANALKNAADNGVSRFVDAFKNSEQNVRNTVVNLVSKSLEGVKALEGSESNGTGFYSEGIKIAECFVNGVNSTLDNAEKIFRSFIEECLAQFKNKANMFGSVGKYLIGKFQDGISDSKDAALTSVKTLISSVVGILKNYYRDFTDCGNYLAKNFADGFAKGIDDNTCLAKNAAVKMAKEALRGAKDELKIKSPSKEAYALGDYTGMGFVNALDDYGRKSYSAGAEMAESAKDGLANAIARINDIIDGKVECRPTVSPVLDLSDIESGVSEMSGMFSARRSINLAAVTSFGADTSIERHKRGSSNQDVVDAVSSLREEVSSLRGVVGNLKVVMDGNALVGQIANRMDRALGTKSNLAKRGL